MKKIGFLTLLILAIALATLAFTAAATPTAPAQPAVTAAAAVAAMPPGEHPEIHAALDAMHTAKDRLEHAAHDFHGHRVESIKHLDMAIHEAEICMQEP
jgi:hypothetical protein